LSASSPDRGATVWWAGTAAVLPRGSLVPPTGSRWLRRFNEMRLRTARPIFAAPRITPTEARRLATPTSTGLGDLLGAWTMPMALAALQGWRLRIPVPANAGGLHHDPSRARLTPERLHEAFAFPEHVTLVSAEAAPDGADWCCTLAAQWHLDACTETSYETIPWWLREAVDRHEYYEACRTITRALDAPTDGPPYCALHARRQDRGAPGDDAALREIASSMASRCPEWAVLSDDPGTLAHLRELLADAGCRVVAPGRDPGDELDRTIADFRTLVGARVVVASVRGGWSAFPYAATRISGAPLVLTEALADSIIWRVIRAQSRVPISGVHHGALPSLSGGPGRSASRSR
jgi:hypothetical protein